MEKELKFHSGAVCMSRERSDERGWMLDVLTVCVSCEVGYDVKYVRGDGYITDYQTS